MSSNTPNLDLVKLSGTDNFSNANALAGNWEKIDEFAGNTNATYITNQYSNVLDAINALRASKTFPFTIQKAGSSSYADLPSGLSRTCEWNLICYGNKNRITAVLTTYTGASSMNGWSWTANIYEGAYTLGWTSVNSQLANYLQFGSQEFTISDSSYGFIDSGISSIDYIIVAAFTLVAANTIVLTSNINTGTANYRFQLMNALNQTIQKSGTVRVHYVYVARSKLGS